VVVTWCLYVPSLGHAFVFDDVEMVARNKHIESLRNIPRFFTPGYWRQERPGRSYRPLVETSLAVNTAVFGKAPWGLRAVNIMQLTVLAVLVYWLAWRLLGSRAAALIAGLVFAVHPMHLETVTVVKNRSEVMAGLFAVVAVLCFLRAVRGAGRWWAWWSAAIGACVLALLSKEVAVALPLVLTAAALLLAPTGRRRRAAALTAPMWLTAAAFLVLLFATMPDRYGAPLGAEFAAARRFAELTGFQRVLVSIKTVGTYLWLLVWPVETCADRAFAIPPDPWRADVLLPWGAVACLVAGTILAWRRNRPLAFALAWLGVALAPVANIAADARRPVAEMRLLGPSIPFALIVGLVLARLGVLSFDLRPGVGRAPGAARRLVTSSIATVVLVAWLLVAGSVIVSSLPHWRDSVSLWERTARQSPSSWRAQYNCGVALGKRAGDLAAAGDQDDALALQMRSVDHLRKAVELDDRQWRGFHGLAVGLTRLGRFDEAEDALRRAAQLAPENERVRKALDDLNRIRRGQP